MPRLLLLASALLFVACSSPAGGARAGRAVPADAPAVRDSLAGPWTFRNLGRPRSHRVTLSAVLDSRIDTLARQDTVSSQTLLEWSLDPAAATPRVLGMVRDFAIIIGSDSAWRSIPELTLPVSFIAVQEREGEQPRFVQPADSSCDARTAAVQALRETWLAPPTRVAIGTRWRDSSSVSSCRDGIMLRATVTRDYVVEASGIRDGALVLLVRRRTATELRGAGVQFGDSVTVTGDADGDALLELSLDGAAIAFGSGSTELRLELRGRRRTQALVQHGALVIRSP